MLKRTKKKSTSKNRCKKQKQKFDANLPSHPPGYPGVHGVTIKHSTNFSGCHEKLATVPEKICLFKHRHFQKIVISLISMSHGLSKRSDETLSMDPWECSIFLVRKKAAQKRGNVLAVWRRLQDISIFLLFAFRPVCSHSPVCWYLKNTTKGFIINHEERQHYISINLLLMFFKCSCPYS